MKQKHLFKLVPNVSIAKMEVVLYSHEQKCYHIESFIDYLKENFEDFQIADDWNGYQIIGLFDNYQEASDFIEKCRELKPVNA